MRLALWKIVSVLSVALTVLILGCGQSEREAYHAELARYTPENLASEMANRFLAGEAATAAKANPANEGEDIDASTKGEAVSKEALAKGGGPADPRIPTASSVALDIARKAESIEGMTREEIFEQIRAILQSDKRLTAPQIETLTDELRKAMRL